MDTPAAADDFNDGFDVTAPPVLHGVPFAGRARFSVLSHLRAAHSSGGGLFGFMTMRESNKLRVQCREARAEVAAFGWMDACWERSDNDKDSHVTGDVAACARPFPQRAQCTCPGAKICATRTLCTSAAGRACGYTRCAWRAARA